jgi:hypothetical protein
MSEITLRYVDAVVKAAATKNLKEALQLIATLVGKPAAEERIPVKFDEGTGKPSEFGWHPYDRWDGELYLGDGYGANLCSISLDGTDSLRKLILKQLRPGETVTFTADDKHFVVTFVPTKSWTSPGGESGGTVRHLEFKEVRAL